MMGLIGVAIGSVLGAAIVIITSHTGIDYSALGSVSGENVGFQGLSFSFILYPEFEFRPILLGAIAVTITSTLASLWPSILAARLQPAEAMRS
jgi:ABC-type antimicrobial peptide transport system permease subunit